MWYWLLRRNDFHLHPKGVANYADKAAALITSQSEEHLKKKQQQVYKLLADGKALVRQMEQKWNKLRDLGHSNNPHASHLTPEAYEDLHIRVSREAWLLLGLFLGEAFLNYLAMVVIIASDAPFMVFVKAVIAAVFTIVAFKVFHVTLESWDTKKESSPGVLRTRIATTFLALLMLVSIAGVTTARARDFEGADNGIGIVGVGFILASLILPVIGGVVDIERDRIRPPYRRMRKWRASLIALRTLEKRLGKHVSDIDDALQEVETNANEQADRMYAGVVDFRVTKDNFDEKRGKEKENYSGTAAATKAAFKTACLSPIDEQLTEYRAGIEDERGLLQEIAIRSITQSGPLAAAHLKTAQAAQPKSQEPAPNDEAPR